MAGYLAALLGLSFYARRRIGARLWRKLHRATVAVYVLGVVHALGAGTDASTLWLRAFMLVTGAPILFLLLVRILPRRKSEVERAPAARRPPGRASGRDHGGRTGLVSRRARSGEGVVIVGGGLAGQRCAETLRRLGYDGAIRIVGDEPVAALRSPATLEGGARGGDRRGLARLPAVELVPRAAGRAAPGPARRRARAREAPACGRRTGRSFVTTSS